jgi:hypothetical protein
MGKVTSSTYVHGLWIDIDCVSNVCPFVSNNCHQTSSIDYEQKLNLGITAIIVKPATLEMGDLGSNETTFHCPMLWLSYLFKY